MAARLFALKPVEAPRLSEADVARQIKDFLGYRGWVIIRCHVGTFVPLRVAREAAQLAQSGRAQEAHARLNTNAISLCDEGTADLLAVHPEFPAIWIETKAPRGKLRPAQKQWLDYMIDKRHFYGGHWDSIDSFIAFYREKISLR